MEIGSINNEILKEFRKRYGLNQKDLAAIIRVNSSNISNWESGYSRTPKWMPMMLFLLKFYSDLKNVPVCSVIYHITNSMGVDKRNDIYTDTREFRQYYHLSQTQLAKLLYVSKSNIQHWERKNGRELPGHVPVLLCLLRNTRYYGPASEYRLYRDRHLWTKVTIRHMKKYFLTDNADRFLKIILAK